MPPAWAQTLPAIRLPWPDNRWDRSDSARAAQCSGWPSSLSLPLQAKCGRFLELHLSGSPALLYIFAGVPVQVSWIQPSAVPCTSFSFGYSSPWLQRPIPAPEAHLGTISFKKKKNVFDCVRAWLGHWDLSLQGLHSLVVAHGHSCPIACGVLVPQPGIKPECHALQVRFLTTRPPGKSWPFLSLILSPESKEG